MPGDPSNTSILSATPAFGGIDVSWTYPVTNPHALAYVLLYRSITSNFALAGTAREATGSLFFDKLDNENTYYYWIRFVSVNGTVSELIGPASAQAKPLIDEMIERLTGQIDAGVLATALRNKIDQVDVVALNLAGEVVSRQNGETTLAGAMADVNAGVAQALTFLANEQTSRVDGDSALATSVNLVATTSAGNLAAVQATLSAEIAVVDGRVTVTGQQVTQVAAQAATNLALVDSTLRAEITVVDDRVDTLSTRVDTVQAGNSIFEAYQTWDFNNTIDGWTFGGGTATPSAESVRFASSGVDPVATSPAVSFSGARYDKIRARVRRVAGTTWDGTLYYATSGHSFSGSFQKNIPDTTALNAWAILEWDMAELTSGGTDWTTNTITLLRLDLGNSASDQFDIDWISLGRRGSGTSFAAVQAVDTARVNGDAALASSITTVQTNAADNLAAAQTSLSTSIATTNGKVTQIGALYTAKVTVNGQIGGFGIYNDGTEVEAGFDVDRFWVGRTNGNRRKPFIIDGDIVYIDDAAIRNAAITWAKIGSLNINADGSIRSGQTSYDVGTGYWMGMVSGVPMMSMGSPTNGFTWNGTTFAVRGSIIATGNVQTNAITAQNSAFTTATATSANAVGTASDSLFTVLTKTFSTSGGAVIVMPQLFGCLLLGANTSDCRISAELVLDGTPVTAGVFRWALGGSYVTNDNEYLGYPALMDIPNYMATLSTGSHTLELKLRYRKTSGSDDVRVVARSGSMIILEFRR